MRNIRYRKEKEMLVQIGNCLYQNAMAIFISAIASLLISKRYYDKANRENVLMMVIFSIVKLLNEKYYTQEIHLKIQIMNHLD
ncbi:MAG: hypothetical protein LUG46_06770 [Erysipelotrichaceae bacterium]|nr:hypothetical protein [Erysipelotrichaceae bacterium]